MSVVHASFSITRQYPVPPAKVFAAWSNVDIKRRWFDAPEGWDRREPLQLDFRIGGFETTAGGPPGSFHSRYKACYMEIVPDARIVYTYDMHLDDKKISVSLATVEFAAAGGGTMLTVTEHGAFLDGYDDSGSREEGTNWLLDNLGKVVTSEAAR